jgi:hypothetical protein
MKLGCTIRSLLTGELSGIFELESSITNFR